MKKCFSFLAFTLIIMLAFGNKERRNGICKIMPQQKSTKTFGNGPNSSFADLSSDPLFETGIHGSGKMDIQ